MLFFQISTYHYETLDWDINAFLVTSLEFGRGNLPFERRMRFPQQPQQPQGPSTNFGTDSGTGLSSPSTQQSTQGGNYMGPNVNNFMQNPFMAGLGSMMGNMFSGGYGSNVSNTQANVAQ